LKTTSDAQKKRILITGGSGYIGSNLVLRLHGKYDIVILDWKEPPTTIAELKIEKHDFDIASPLKKWAVIGKCHYVFHSAAQISAPISEEDPVRDFLSNAYGTFLVAEYARKYSAKVIYCNSIRVYDPDEASKIVLDPKYGKVGEECPTINILNKPREPQPPFALSKYLGEQYLCLYAQRYKLQIISHRMSGIVGPGQIGSPKHAWLSYLVQRAVEGKSYNIYGDGTQTRDVLHINDLLDLVEMELMDFEKFSQNGFAIYNIGGGLENKLSIRKVIDILEKKHNLEFPYKNENRRLGEPKHFVTDWRKISQKGWQPKRTNPEQIIGELVDWHSRRKVIETF